MRLRFAPIERLSATIRLLLTIAITARLLEYVLTLLPGRPYEGIVFRGAAGASTFDQPLSFLVFLMMGAQGVCGFLVVLTVLSWVIRVNRNAVVLGARSVTVSPAWAGAGLVAYPAAGLGLVGLGFLADTAFLKVEGMAVEGPSLFTALGGFLAIWLVLAVPARTFAQTWKVAQDASDWAQRSGLFGWTVYVGAVVLVLSEQYFYGLLLETDSARRYPFTALSFLSTVFVIGASALLSSFVGRATRLQVDQIAAMVGHSVRIL